jgi:hypothetical protein
MTRRDWQEIAHLCRNLRDKLDVVTVYALRNSLSSLAWEMLQELGLVEHQGAELVEGKTMATGAALEELQAAGLVKGEGEALHVTALGWKVLGRPT